ncbi:hypothetical protein [Sphingomonas sp. Leaf357]|uniref:hypothetical protein n=1 Tax=Sphingomonas sp. Leaf357 TaxID=1736350 RepID=UPI000AF8E21E|nr:hypothetical protein [Sphingomonas sp. Leaf357]
MIKTVIAALSGALIAAATPAFADIAKPATEVPVEASTSAVAPSISAKTAVKPTNYCVVQRITGSMLPIRTCHTREDWLSRGFDPLAK